MKTILIKASGVGNSRWNPYISGVGRSTTMLLDSLSKQEKLPFNIKVYASGTSSLSIDYSRWRFSHFSFPLPEKCGMKDLWVEPIFRKSFVKYDLLHIPHNDDYVFKSENFVVTMHDVFEYDMALRDGDKKRKERWERMALSSRGIITCSEFSKAEIIDRFGIDADKVDVAYWGIDTNLFYKESEEVVQQGIQRLDVRNPYFLSVSCSAPRKNVRTLLKAYRLFAQGGVKHGLVLVWGNPPQDILDEYAKEIEQGKIKFLSHVSDDDLRVLYSGATALMFPSRAEGFGFPILEAFACETPVMTCRNTSLQEVGGDVALYVGENSVDDMVDVMCLFEKGQYKMELFNVKAQQIVNSFSWDKTAKKYIDFYSKYL